MGFGAINSKLIELCIEFARGLVLASARVLSF